MWSCAIVDVPVVVIYVERPMARQLLVSRDGQEQTENERTVAPLPGRNRWITNVVRAVTHDDHTIMDSSAKTQQFVTVPC